MIGYPKKKLTITQGSRQIPNQKKILRKLILPLILNRESLTMCCLLRKKTCSQVNTKGGSETKKSLLRNKSKRKR